MNQEVDNTQEIHWEKQKAERLNCGGQTVRRLTRELGLPEIRYNHNFRYDPRALDEWIAQHRFQPFYDVSLHSGKAIERGKQRAGLAIESGDSIAAVQDRATEAII